MNDCSTSAEPSSPAAALSYPSATQLPTRVAAVATGQSVITDLADLISQPEPGEAGARIAVRFAEETAELAAMIRALPGWPREMAGHTYAAVEALVSAAQNEHDFAGWLADVLCQAAERLGSSEALIAGRPGSWEARLVYQLAAGTAAPDDENPPGYGAGGAS